MNDKDAIILQKILKYIGDVQMYTDGMHRNDFIADSKTISATAFALGQIGELSKLISADTEINSPELPWVAMRGLRNRIVHDYENVSHNILWDTISESLPELYRQIKALLNTENL